MRSGFRPLTNVSALVHIVRLFSAARDDERRARFVYEYGVHLVHYGVRVAALHGLLLVDDHVVSEVVKAELVVRAVGYVRGVGFLFVLFLYIVGDEADGQAHKVVQLAHPLAVAAGQVVVYCHDVYALARQRV